MINNLLQWDRESRKGPSTRNSFQSQELVVFRSNQLFLILKIQSNGWFETSSSRTSTMASGGKCFPARLQFCASMSMKALSGGELQIPDMPSTLHEGTHHCSSACATTPSRLGKRRRLYYSKLIFCCFHKVSGLFGAIGISSPTQQIVTFHV